VADRNDDERRSPEYDATVEGSADLLDLDEGVRRATDDTRIAPNPCVPFMPGRRTTEH